MTLVDGKDPDAFEVFYDRHGGAAYSLAHRIVGDPGMAEDVTQEAFLSIWRSKARFDAARGSVRSWTLGIVRNRAIDALRSASRPAPKLDSRRRVRAREPARRRADRRRGDPPRDRRPRPRRAGAAAARAVAGDRARLLRRLQPLGDRRDAGDADSAPSRAGCGSASRRSGPPSRRGSRRRTSRGLTCERGAASPRVTSATATTSRRTRWALSRSARRSSCRVTSRDCERLPRAAALAAAGRRPAAGARSSSSSRRRGFARRLAATVRAEARKRAAGLGSRPRSRAACATGGPCCGGRRQRSLPGR